MTNVLPSPFGFRRKWPKLGTRRSLVRGVGEPLLRQTAEFELEMGPVMLLKLRTWLSKPPPKVKRSCPCSLMMVARVMNIPLNRLQKRPTQASSGLGIKFWMPWKLAIAVPTLRLGLGLNQRKQLRTAFGKRCLPTFHENSARHHTLRNPQLLGLLEFWQFVKGRLWSRRDSLEHFGMHDHLWKIVVGLGGQISNHSQHPKVQDPTQRIHQAKQGDHQISAATQTPLTRHTWMSYHIVVKIPPHCTMWVWESVFGWRVFSKSPSWSLLLPC